MSTVTLKEFIAASGLPESIVLNLLCEKALPCSLSESKELLINMDELDLDTLYSDICKGQEAHLQEFETVTKERFATTIANHIDSIFEEACAKYLSQKG